jgi:hypothetical protein
MQPAKNVIDLGLSANNLELAVLAAGCRPALRQSVNRARSKPSRRIHGRFWMHGHALVLPHGPQTEINDWTKGETESIANPSYPRSALSLHFAIYVERSPAKDGISRGLPGMFTPKYQESACGKRVASARACNCGRHSSSAGPLPRTASIAGAQRAYRPNPRSARAPSRNDFASSGE